MTTVAASVPVLRWAAQRARLQDDDLLARFPKWPKWLSGEAQPTLALPVPDFRTLRDEALAEPSAALLDTLYLCQQRQDWYRDHARMHGLPVLSFVGSASARQAPDAVARRLRATLGLSAEARRRLPTWTEALRELIAKTEDAGVMVMVSSVVGKLAHVWLGVTGVSDTQAGQVPEQHTERWCNQVAAELLMPLQELQAAHQRNVPMADEIQRLAREFKVSTLVALRRLFDAGYITRNSLWKHYREEQERLRTQKERSSGCGDFYRSLGARTSKRFARAIVSSTLEGLTSFPDAFRMLGLRKTATFYEAARELGVTA